MTDHHSRNGHPLPGYRLKKLEVFNWGTFDSRKGQIYTLRIDGQSALLVGQNATGKSTLVDALLTLLVRPVVRNYNVAAGAQKQERDERTYIRGACGRSSRDDDNRADIQYLRPRNGYYSVLLACFCNEQNGRTFTVAQLLYLDSENAAGKVYCFSPKELSIADSFADLENMERIKEQMRRRGFRATTSYTEYHSWFAKETGVQPKAMDVFNQTVAVKDIQKLNAFIRDHMLEAKPWGKRVEGLMSHFVQLSEAYKSLVEVRKQLELLNPIAETGAEYRAAAKQANRQRLLVDALDSFFREKSIELFTPRCEALRGERERVHKLKDSIERERDQAQEECRRLKNEIEQAGGDRLKQIPFLIERHESHAEAAQGECRRYHDALRDVGIQENIHDANSFNSLRARLSTLTDEHGRQIALIEAAKGDLIIERASILRELSENNRELEALSRRRENLPESFAVLRRQICGELRLPESDLPFAGELIAVKPEDRPWEASIELTLRGFALSLLVPQRHYALVSRYVDRTKLFDPNGRGQKLVYLRVGERQPKADGPSLHPQSLLRKLAYRQGHPLLPWIKAELLDRFDYRCCETIEEFQQAHSLALTAHRHMKVRDVRHEKDDRERASDPRHYVLGWDNRDKLSVLAAEISRLSTQDASLTGTIEKATGDLDRLRGQQTAAKRAREVTDFSAIDPAPHERAIKALQKEKQSLEDSTDALRLLKRRLKEEDSRYKQLVARRDDIIRRDHEMNKEIGERDKLIANARAILHHRSQQKLLAAHEQQYSELERQFDAQPLTADDLLDREKITTQHYRESFERLRQELEPLVTRLNKLMNRFLIEIPSERSDLQSDIEYLEGFIDLREHLAREDLPRHEQRFKERLNEKVTHEIGLFNGALQSECIEIKSKLDTLNLSLRQLEYRPGTFMRLEPRPSRDKEISDFQEAMKECLAGTFEGTLEADEARYKRIEKLIVRLAEEPRWRDKVADVRRWFDFVARELDATNGEERAYYEDSVGQSGGEKAKLAFTILVAAIAYQYDIAPDRTISNRFHFVVVDEMFSKVDDQYAEYALELFQKFGLQLLIVAPLDAKARVTEPYVGCYLHVVKDNKSLCSEIFSMTSREFEAVTDVPSNAANGVPPSAPLSKVPK